MKLPVSESVVTAPTLTPVTPSELKAHARIDHNEEDGLFEIYLNAAIEDCQNYQQRQYLTATYDYKFDAFPYDGEPITLPRSPLASVTSITYIASDGTSTTWDSSDYRVDTASEPPRITPAYGESYPTTRDVTGAVTIRAVMGHTSAALVPANTKAAVLLLANQLYQTREPVSGLNGNGGGVPREIPYGLRHLLDGNVVEFV